MPLHIATPRHGFDEPFKTKEGECCYAACACSTTTRGPISAHVTTALLEKFKWDILDHPPYNLDLAPSDFHLFLHLNKHLAGKKFDDYEEVQEEVMTWFKGQAADFYGSGTQKLVPRLNKCLYIGGDYVEK